jgi:hypothetical protein
MVDLIVSFFVVKVGNEDNTENSFFLSKGRVIREGEYLRVWLQK